uniref:Uncharacterized protein n=1 Tax=Rhizophora mucronata TaxID=61149 RepID=A0A2P2Q3Q7_RHIMU
MVTLLAEITVFRVRLFEVSLSFQWWI